MPHPFLISDLPVSKTGDTPLRVDGKVVAVARQPLLRPIFSEGSADVYVGKERIFSLPENFLDGSPIFIYPFADGRRFLCDYDDDTERVTFVVTLDASDINKDESNAFRWPLDGYIRNYMAGRLTNVVFVANGFVRLPDYAELLEVSSYLTGATPRSIKAGYFNFLDFGIKDMLLLDLATNRQSFWPMPKK